MDVFEVAYVGICDRTPQLRVLESQTRNSIFSENLLWDLYGAYKAPQEENREKSRKIDQIS